MKLLPKRERERERGERRGERERKRGEGGGVLVEGESRELEGWVVYIIFV